MMDLAQSDRLHRIRLLRHENAEKAMLRAKTACAAAEREASRARERRTRFDARRRQETKRIYDEILHRQIALQELDEARGRESHLKERLALLTKEAEEKKREALARREDYEKALRALHKEMRALNKAEKILDDARQAARAEEAAREDAQIDDFAERMAYARG